MKATGVVKGIVTGFALVALVGCAKGRYVIRTPRPVVVEPESRPPGWDRGVKRGWETNLPPGQQKKLTAARLRIRTLCRDRVLSEAETNRIMVAFDLGASKGVSITVVESAFAVSLRAGMTTAEIEVLGGTLDAEIGDVDEASLEIYIKAQISAGIRGAALGKAINTELKKPKPAKGPKPTVPGKGKGKGKGK